MGATLPLQLLPAALSQHSFSQCRGSEGCCGQIWGQNTKRTNNYGRSGLGEAGHGELCALLRMCGGEAEQRGVQSCHLRKQCQEWHTLWKITRPKATSVICKQLQVTSRQDCVGAEERAWHRWRRWEKEQTRRPTSRRWLVLVLCCRLVQAWVCFQVQQEGSCSAVLTGLRSPIFAHKKKNCNRYLLLIMSLVLHIRYIQWKGSSFRMYLSGKEQRPVILLEVASIKGRAHRWNNFAWLDGGGESGGGQKNCSRSTSRSYLRGKSRHFLQIVISELFVEHCNMCLSRFLIGLVQSQQELHRLHGLSMGTEPFLSLVQSCASVGCVFSPMLP